MKLLSSIVYALLLFGLLVPAAALAKPRLGFGIAVATDGFLSSTLAEVKVVSVQVGSPSEKAGLKKADLIIEMNGIATKGANGHAMKKMLGGIKAGEHLLLKVQRGRDSTHVIDIVAGP